MIFSFRESLLVTKSANAQLDMLSCLVDIWSIIVDYFGFLQVMCKLNVFKDIKLGAIFLLAQQYLFRQTSKLIYAFIISRLFMCIYFFAV